jgi:hypothetical protein
MKGKGLCQLVQGELSREPGSDWTPWQEEPPLSATL